MPVEIFLGWQLFLRLCQIRPIYLEFLNVGSLEVQNKKVLITQKQKQTRLPNLLREQQQEMVGGQQQALQ